MRMKCKKKRKELPQTINIPTHNHRQQPAPNLQEQQHTQSTIPPTINQPTSPTNIINPHHLPSSPNTNHPPNPLSCHTTHKSTTNQSHHKRRTHTPPQHHNLTSHPASTLSLSWIYVVI